MRAGAAVAWFNTWHRSQPEVIKQAVAAWHVGARYVECGLMKSLRSALMVAVAALASVVLIGCEAAAKPGSTAPATTPTRIVALNTPEWLHGRWIGATDQIEIEHDKIIYRRREYPNYYYKLGYRATVTDEGHVWPGTPGQMLFYEESTITRYHVSFKFVGSSQVSFTFKKNGSDAINYNFGCTVHDFSCDRRQGDSLLRRG